jgi:hypothetical protein
MVARSVLVFLFIYFFFLMSICVCFYLTSGFAWPVRPRDAGPGADHRTGRVELPIYIIQVYYYYTCGTIVYPYRWCLEEHGSNVHLSVLGCETRGYSSREHISAPPRPGSVSRTNSDLRQGFRRRKNSLACSGLGVGSYDYVELPI